MKISLSPRLSLDYKSESVVWKKSFCFQRPTCEHQMGERLQEAKVVKDTCVDLSLNFWKKNPNKKLSFICSQFLKNTKIHVNLLILVLKVCLWVIEPKKLNFEGCIWWNSEVFSQNVLMRGRSKYESKNCFCAKSKNDFP
jgi:hypothetical protein